jgi:hypothetical protein
MQSMVTEEAAPVQVGSQDLGRVEVGDLELPYVDLEDAPAIRNKLILYDTEYTYVQSFPIRGHSAVMPGAVNGLLAQGRPVLIAERGERYYVYAA